MLQTIVWLLPASRIKNRLLRLFGHDIAPTACLEPNLVWRVERFEIGDAVHIFPGNVFLNLRRVRMRPYASIASWNWITADPSCRNLDENAGTVFFGTRAKLGSRCQVDCSGTVVLRAFSSVGGNQCLLESSEWDARLGERRIGRITVGHHSLVGSRAVMGMGAAVPDQSLLASNSTMVALAGGSRGVYAGSPAQWRRATDGKWFTRTTYEMTEHVAVEPLGIQPADLEPEKDYAVSDGQHSARPVGL
jgi:acetyltransferase-like isoleucine patch superfamily enzyme